MPVLDDVRKLIERLAPEPICDTCIAAKLDLSGPQHANRKSRELAGTGGFERMIGLCSICAGEKLVIRRR